MSIERSLLQLEKEIGVAAFAMRCAYMSDHEMAVYHNGLALKARSAEYQHRQDAERQRHERILRGR